MNNIHKILDEIKTHRKEDILDHIATEYIAAGRAVDMYTAMTLAESEYERASDHDIIAVLQDMGITVSLSILDLAETFRYCEKLKIENEWLWDQQSARHYE